MIIERILIVGLGSMGKVHLRLARELLPNANICVLRHHECKESLEYANACFSSLEEALVFAPQVAVIANPSTFHMQVAIPLAQVGAHLLVEKPLSVSSTNVEKLISTINSKGTVLAIGYNLRFLPSLKLFRDHLKNRELIGKIYSVRCETGQYLPSWRNNTDYRNGVSARHKLGGGVLLELSHEIDYIRWIFGEIDWISAVLVKQSDLEIDVEDSAHLILGIKENSENSKFIANINLDFIRHDTTRLCTVIGEKGSLRWNGITRVVEHYKVNSKKWEILFKDESQQYDSYRLEWQHFLSCINNKAKPLITGEDGFKVIQIIEAARLAAETGIKTNV